MTCVYKCGEKFLVFRITITERLRMPLDTQDKRITGQLDSLDQPVRCGGADLQPCTGIFDALMMPAVHIQGRNTNDGKQQGISFQINCMDRVTRHIITGMLQSCPELFRQIPIQISPQHTGKHLHSTADGKDRHPAVYGLPAKGGFH